MAMRTIGRAIGALYLLAFVAYLAGGGLVDAVARGADPLAGVAAESTRLAAGALLMLVNSAIVVAAGILAVRVLKPRHETSAYGYLVLRAVEGVLLAAGVVFLLLLVPLATEHARADPDAAATLTAFARVAQATNEYCYQLGMIAGGAAGLLFCRALLLAGLVPRFLAVWGLAGYAVFLAGAAAEVLGYRVGLLLSVPGGLFELVLGVLLMARGLPVRYAGKRGPQEISPVPDRLGGWRGAAGGPF